MWQHYLHDAHGQYCKVEIQHLQHLYSVDLETHDMTSLLHAYAVMHEHTEFYIAAAYLYASGIHAYAPALRLILSKI